MLIYSLCFVLRFFIYFFFLRGHCCWWSCCCLPLAEGVQAGQDLGVAVVIQTDAADQELLVYLTHHWAGAPSLVLGHGRGHLNPGAAANLYREREIGRGEREKGEREREKTVSFRVLLNKLGTGGTRNQSSQSSSISRSAQITCPLFRCCFWVNTSREP